MDIKFIPFLLLLILCWTLNPFFKKKVISQTHPMSFAAINSTLCAFFFIALALVNRVHIDFKILKNRWLWAGLSTTCASSLSLIYLLKVANVGYLIPHTQPIVLLLTVFYGYWSGEHMNIHQLSGAVFVVIGLVLLNMKTNKGLPT